jgi:hypothetical protein
MRKYLVVTTVLQVLMVTGGHFSDALLARSAVLGTIIPLIMGAWFGSVEPRNLGRAAGGGFAIGLLPAAIGILVAIALGDHPWILLPVGALASGLTGSIGSVVSFMTVGRSRPVAD